MASTERNNHFALLGGGDIFAMNGSTVCPFARMTLIA
jgi:hypothetical protein